MKHPTILMNGEVLLIEKRGEVLVLPLPLLKKNTITLSISYREPNLFPRPR